MFEGAALSADVVVIGAGPNGLVAANLLADRGLGVTVIEEADEPGGAVRSGELIEPSYTHDLFSAFYPFARASPHIRRLELERYGLSWLTPQTAVAHPAADGSCPAISLDIERTAASLEQAAPGDGTAWRELYATWQRVRAGALGAFFTPFPPIRPALRLARELGPGGLLRLARFSLLPVRRMGEETFSGEVGTRLLAGNALHADVSPEAPLSGIYGWVLCSLAQDVGFPVVAGGASGLTTALVKRLSEKGGELICGQRVTSIECSGGRVTAVHTPEHRYPAAEAVIADVGAPQLYEQLLRTELLPSTLREDISRFQYDSSTFKVDWTLDGPIPWAAERAREAGTIHIGDSIDELSRYATDLACGAVPEGLYLVLGQYSHIDPSRAPAGKETAWAYTHIPQRAAAHWDEKQSEQLADGIEARIELLAPGFRSLIRGRHIFSPAKLELDNRNLVGGALNGGTAQLHQQLVFRPLPGLARAETPIARLFLGSASAHPGGGVHGGPGANAAAAALAAIHKRPRPAAAFSRAFQRGGLA